MNQDQFREMVEQGAKCVEAKEFHEACAIFEELVSSDVPRLDKAVVCVNLAIVHERMNDPDGALYWYDEAMMYESGSPRIWASELKAAYLVLLGRPTEARELYGRILARNDLTEVDRRRIEGNVRSVADLEGDPKGRAIVCPDLTAGGAVQIRGAARPIWLAAMWLALVGALLFHTSQIGLWPGAAQWPASVLGFGLLWCSGVLFLTGIPIRLNRLELDAAKLRYRGVFRTREVPLDEITAVSLDTRVCGDGSVVGASSPIRFWVGETKGLEVESRVFQHDELLTVLYTLLRLRPNVQMDQAARAALGLRR